MVMQCAGCGLRDDQEPSVKPRANLDNAFCNDCWRDAPTNLVAGLPARRVEAFQATIAALLPLSEEDRVRVLKAVAILAGVVI